MYFTNENIVFHQKVVQLLKDGSVDILLCFHIVKNPMKRPKQQLTDKGNTDELI